MSQAYLCMRFRIFLTPKLCKAPLKPYLLRIAQNPHIEMHSTFWLWRSIRRDSRKAQSWFRWNQRSLFRNIFVYFILGCVHKNTKILAEQESTSVRYQTLTLYQFFKVPRTQLMSPSILSHHWWAISLYHNLFDRLISRLCF